MNKSLELLVVINSILLGIGIIAMAVVFVKFGGPSALIGGG